MALRKVERQVKVLIKNLAIFFLFPSKEILPRSFKIPLLETSLQKQKEQRQKQLGADKVVYHTNLEAENFYVSAHLAILKSKSI
jgi:hypothetical protein